MARGLPLSGGSVFAGSAPRSQVPYARATQIGPKDIAAFIDLGGTILTSPVGGAVLRGISAAGEALGVVGPSATAPAAPSGPGPTSPEARQRAAEALGGLALPPREPQIPSEPTAPGAMAAPPGPTTETGGEADALVSGIRQLPPDLQAAMRAAYTALEAGERPVAPFERLKAEGLSPGEAADVVTTAQSLLASAAGRRPAGPPPTPFPEGQTPPGALAPPEPRPTALQMEQRAAGGAPAPAALSALPPGGAGEVPPAAQPPSRDQRLDVIVGRIAEAMKQGASGADIVQRLMERGAAPAEARAVVQRAMTRAQARTSATHPGAAGEAALPAAPPATAPVEEQAAQAGVPVAPAPVPEVGRRPEEILSAAAAAVEPAQQAAVIRAAVESARPESIFDSIFGTHQRRAALEVAKLFPTKHGGIPLTPEQLALMEAKAAYLKKQGDALPSLEEQRRAAAEAAKARAKSEEELRAPRREELEARTEAQTTLAEQRRTLTPLQVQKIKAEIAKLNADAEEALRQGGAGIRLQDKMQIVLGTYRGRMQILAGQIARLEKAKIDAGNIAAGIPARGERVSKKVGDAARNRLAGIAEALVLSKTELATLEAQGTRILEATTDAELLAALRGESPSKLRGGEPPPGGAISPEDLLLEER